MVTIGTRLSRAAEQIALAEESGVVWCTVGTHPHHAAEEDLPEEQALAELASHPRVVGIGESGLDYFYDRSPRDVQAASFRRHIRAARLAGVPILRDVAAKVPLDRLLVETDAPFLAPVPNRGKRNEPAWVAHTARVLAEVRGLTPAALAELTTANFLRLFRKAR
jgi:Tat protein secretion system quality control protein TatD with DNase activity